MSVHEWLENVNESTLFVCFCLFWWLVFVALRADNLLVIPYWALFIPLWFWKVVVFLGWSIGIIVWLRQRRSLSIPRESPYILEDPAVPHIQAMSVSTFFSLLLSCSEILLCLHLSYPNLQLAYLTIMTPLLLVGTLGILGFFFVMVDCRSLFAWSRRNRRRQLLGVRSAAEDQLPEELELAFSSLSHRRVCSFTMELYVSANMLQIIFLIARLDNWIRSKWTVTFIPTFILLGMGFLFCTIGFVVALIRYFTALFVPMYQRRVSIRYYASYILINFLLCTSVAFLALRLDDYLSPNQISYSLICTPVLISLTIYAVNSFYMGPGNPWWFGLNRNILLTLFQSVPTLQLCANTSVGNAVVFWKFPTGDHLEHNGLTQSSDQHPTVDGTTESVSDFNSRSAVLVAHNSTQQDSLAGPSSPQLTHLYKQLRPVVSPSTVLHAPHSRVDGGAWTTTSDATTHYNRACSTELVGYPD